MALNPASQPGGQINQPGQQRKQQQKCLKVPAHLTVYRPLRPAPRELFCVPSTDQFYRQTASYFSQSWQHPDKAGKMESLYVLNSDLQLQVYVYVYHKPKKAEFRFHGTRRACTIGENGSTRPCFNSECRICCILRDSFKLNNANPVGMFGRGIYSTLISSKADIYAMNHHIRSSKHAIILCLVMCDRPQPLFKAEHGRTGPDSGFNAVEAVTGAQGGHVIYPETVVYDEGAIIPFGLIIYTRDGWTPSR